MSNSAAGVDIQSQAAYELACQGLLRPAAVNQPAFSGPVLYDIRCIQFKPPVFTLGRSFIHRFMYFAVFPMFLFTCGVTVDVNWAYNQEAAGSVNLCNALIISAVLSS